MRILNYQKILAICLMGENEKVLRTKACTKESNTKFKTFKFPISIWQATWAHYSQMYSNYNINVPPVRSTKLYHGIYFQCS